MNARTEDERFDLWWSYVDEPYDASDEEVQIALVAFNQTPSYCERDLSNTPMFAETSDE